MIILDNIETSRTEENLSELLNINDSELESLESLYIKSNIESYKNLSIDTALSMLESSSELIRKRGDKILNCGTEVCIQDLKIVSANFCRQRLCPMCQRRKSLKTYSDFNKVLSELRNYAFLHLVLTVPNCEPSELSSTVSDMNKCSSRMFSINALKRAFKGVARFTEVTFNSNTLEFHPHFHCLIAVNKSYFTSRAYIKASRIRAFWTALWQHREQDFRRLKDETIDDWASRIRDEELLQIHIGKADDNALPEIAKYAVKPLELQIDHGIRIKVLEWLFEGLHNKRLVQTYGVIREACRKLKIDFDSLETFDDNPQLDSLPIYRYTWNWSHTGYEFSNEFTISRKLIAD